LIDLSTARVGWWVGKENLDTVVPYDGYADQTMAVLDHTKFAEVTNYGSEMGSGIMDIYQNCFLPSAGPPIGPAEGKKGVCSLPEIPTILTPCGADSDCGKEGEYCICPVDDDHPYCCDGRAMNEDAWKESKCFTGF